MRQAVKLAWTSEQSRFWTLWRGAGTELFTASLPSLNGSLARPEACGEITLRTRRFTASPVQWCRVFKVVNRRWLSRPRPVDPLLTTRPMDLNLTPKEPLTCSSTTGTWKGRLSSLYLPCSSASAQADRPARSESRPESKVRSRYDLLPPWSKRNWSWTCF